MHDNNVKMTMRSVVGRNVEKARRDMDLSQQALGARLEQWLEVPWSRQAVSLAELGKRAFGVDDLVGLSVGLRVSIRDLLTPQPEVDTIVLASGMELPRSFIEQEVIGTGSDSQEMQRTRYRGHLEELEAAVGLLAQRKEMIQQRLAELESQQPPAEPGRESSLSEAVQEQSGTVPTKGQLWIGIPEIKEEDDAAPAPRSR